MTGALKDLITELDAAEHGQLIDRSRVFDDLLDLRLAAEGDLRATQAIDVHLADVPGRSTVTADWWAGVLAELGRLSECELTY